MNGRVKLIPPQEKLPSKSPALLGLKIFLFKMEKSSNITYSIGSSLQANIYNSMSLLFRTKVMVIKLCYIV